jgi:hypothetical protein
MGFQPGQAYHTFGLGDGTPFVVGVNANPDVTFEGSFFVVAQFGGNNYPAMLDPFVRLALARGQPKGVT